MITKDNDFMPNFASFLESESVGVFTLHCLHFMLKKKDEIDLNWLYTIIRDKIVTCKDLCSRPYEQTHEKGQHNLTYGCCGYLYALITI